MTEKHGEPFEINKEDNVYNIEGPFARKLFLSTNFDDYDSLQYFQRTLKNKGIIKELEKIGIEEGDIVKIYDMEFEYVR